MKVGNGDSEMEKSINSLVEMKQAIILRKETT